MITHYHPEPADEGEPMVEDPHGAYVRFDDVVDVIEAHRKKWEDCDHRDHEAALAELLEALEAEQ